MNKLKTILTSSRFIVGFATIIGLIGSRIFGIELSLEGTTVIVGTVAGWIAGRTIRPETGTKIKGLLTSSRFLSAATAIIGVIGAESIGVEIDAKSATVILGVVVSIIGGRTFRPEDKSGDGQEMK